MLAKVVDREFFATYPSEGEKPCNVDIRDYRKKHFIRQIREWHVIKIYGEVTVSVKGTRVILTSSMTLLWRCRRCNFKLSSPFVTFRSLQGVAFDREQYWNRKLSRMEDKEANKGEQRPAVKRPTKDTLNKPLRGRPRDQEDVRISKTLSWLLRHGAKSEGLGMRPDGYVRVQDLVSNSCYACLIKVAE